MNSNGFTSLIYYLLLKVKLKDLVKQGLRLGKNVYIGNDVVIDPAFPWLISIGDDCFISARSIILAHDSSTKKHIGYTRVGKVTIGRNTFIGMGSVILPGVKIGDNSIIGAGSVVTTHVPEDSVAVGNPVVVVGKTSKFAAFHKQKMKCVPIFEEGWTNETGIDDQRKKLMEESLENSQGYVI